MTDTLTGMLSEAEFLEHYGVKGMKWGQLREQAAAGSKGAQKKLDKADRKWEKSSHGTAAYIQVHNRMAERMNGKMMDDFNANPKYKKIKDKNNWDDPKVQEYHSDFAKLSNKVFAEATKEIYGTSPSGRYSCEVKKDSDGNYYAEMVDSQAEHDEISGNMRFAILKDDSGQILGLGKQLSETLTHQEGNSMTDSNTLTHGMLTEEDFLAHIGATPEMTEDEFLEHFGVKGMKWGKRSASSGPKMTKDGREVKSRKELRGLDKATSARQKGERKAEAAKNDSKIDAARARVNSGKNAAAYKTAKAQYKNDKRVIGKKAAAEAFNKVKNKNIEDYNKSREAKSGRETVVAVIGAIASVAIIAAAHS